MKIDIQDHMLVPTHEIMTEDEIADELSDVEYDFKDLPKIKLQDPVVKAIGAEVGDVLRITRESQTAGVFITYRIVED